MSSRALQSLCARGELDKAMELLCGTHAPLPSNTYLSLLKACKNEKSKALDQAQQVRSHITHHNVPLSGLLGDYLVVTLSMCGAVDDALLTSRVLPHRSVFSWTSIISGYVEDERPRDALETYQSMLQDGVEPNQLTLVALLRASGDIGELDQGRQLHAYSCMKGFTSDTAVGNAIMSMYLNCGAIGDAEDVFMALPDCTLLSWNSMLFACLDHGQAEKVLQFYEEMQLEPNHHTFVSVSKACGTIKDLEQGLRLHAHARAKGLVSDLMVSSSLMSMYGKCGAITEAEDLFGQSLHRDVVSWNSMLSIYVEQGQGERALRLYRQMQEEGVTPTGRTLVFAVRACSVLAEMEESRLLKAMLFDIGHALHAIAHKKYFQHDAFLCSALVSMYGKCGAIPEAEELFCTTSERDLVLWNAMLSAYTEHGQGGKALRLFWEMEKQSKVPDQPTFVTVVQAVSLLREEEEPLSEGRFSRVMSLEIGFSLHGSACAYALASDTIVGSALVSMYGRCGALPEAEHTYYSLLQETVVPWNAMLSAYVEQCQGERAVQLYRQVQMVGGPSPDEITFTLLLQACGTMADQEESSHKDGISSKLLAFKLGQGLHVDSYRRGFPYDVSIGNTLLSLYGKCGAILEAEDVFCSLPNRTVVSWNAMLSMYVENGQGERALQLYTQMHRESLSPDELTFVCALQACMDLAEKGGDDYRHGKSAKMVSLEIGRALHSDCDTQGYASYAFIRNTLVRMYGKCGAIKEAEELFTFLSDRRSDHECGSLLDDAFVTQSGNLSVDVQLQKEWSSFPLQDAVSYNAMLLAYAEQGHIYKALQLHNDMRACGLFVNLLSVTRMLQACSVEGSVEICLELHFAIVSTGYDWVSSTAATLIHAYGNCASMVDMDTSLEALSAPDIIAWNACISGYAGEGNSARSLFLLDELTLTEIEPKDATFLSILSACCQAGLVSVGFNYFESMREYHTILPDYKHYCSLLDLLGRAGDFKRIRDMLERAPIERSLITWLTLLGACRSHGNSAVAKLAYDHAVGLQPNQATAYVLMSNICANEELLADGQDECFGNRQPLELG